MSLLISCSPPNTDDESSSGNNKNNGPTLDDESFETSVDAVGPRYAIIGATAKANLSNVGFIVTDSDTDLVHNDALKADKAYYTRNMTPNNKMQVYFSFLKDFVLAGGATDYNPDPLVVSTGIDATTLKVLQPNTTYYVHIFYTVNGSNKVKKVEFTTAAFPTTLPTVSITVQIQAKVGELIATPSLLPGTGGILFLEIKCNGSRAYSQLVSNGESLTVASGGPPGVILYEFTNTTDGHRDFMMFREIRAGDFSLRYEYVPVISRLGARGFFFPIQVLE